MPRDDACNYQMSKFDQLKEFVLYCCNILVNRAYNFQICYRLLSQGLLQNGQEGSSKKNKLFCLKRLEKLVKK